jgi:hypothetical protein
MGGTMSRLYLPQIVIIVFIAVTQTACFKSADNGAVVTDEPACVELPAACEARLNPVENDCDISQDPSSQLMIIAQDRCSATVTSQDAVYDCTLTGQKISCNSGSLFEGVTIRQTITGEASQDGITAEIDWTWEPREAGGEMERCSGTTELVCVETEIPDGGIGAEGGMECLFDMQCEAEGAECINGDCVVKEMDELVCPENMVPIDQRFCIDVYEASRPDATATSSGADESAAVSRADVLPWQVANNEEADSACRAAGKILCTEDQWYQACEGPEGTVYAYGDDYIPTICNGIDTFCYCDDEACQDADVCPYPHCYHTCGASFHLTPTGGLSGCTNSYGVFDMNGNLWEHVLGGDETRIRGGAFNCSDSETLHRCDYIPGNWTPSARGFRCCSEGWFERDTETN